MMENTANLVWTTCVVFFMWLCIKPKLLYDSDINNNNNNNIDDLLTVPHSHPLSYKESYICVTQSFKSLWKRCLQALFYRGGHRNLATFKGLLLVKFWVRSGDVHWTDLSIASAWHSKTLTLVASVSSSSYTALCYTGSSLKHCCSKTLQKTMLSIKL